MAAAWFTKGALHDGVGYAALCVIAVRITWGAIGPRYARFRQFVVAPAVTLAYARAVAARSEPRYLGHNPLGGWMIVALLATVALTAASGWLSSTDRFWGVAWLQDTHAAQKRSEEHTSELQSLTNLVCRLLLEKKKKGNSHTRH